MLEFPEWISDIVTSGDLAYILSDGKVFVMDVSDPEKPVEITAFEYTEEFWRPGITIEGDHVYIYNRHVPGAVYWPYSPPERQLIQIFDFSEPTDPRLVASYDQHGTLIALDVEGKFVFVTVDDSLMTVLGLDEGIFPQQEPASSSDESMVQELEGAVNSQAGITAEVLRVEYLDDKTLVDFRVSVDSRWKLTNGESMPPQQALVYPILFDDRGNAIVGHSTTNDLGTFYPSGRVSYTNRSIFDPIPQDVKTLTLRIDTTTLTEIPGEEILELDLTGREPGDTWRIDETLSVRGIPFTITEVHLDQAESVDKQYRLEFITDSPIVIESIEAIEDPISIQSLYIFESNYSAIEMADTGRFDASQASVDGKIVAVYEFGPDTRIVKTPISVPEGVIEYRIVGYIIIAGPWEITWEVESLD
ncbi:MAG TPA: hypothetical protein G4O11_11740 [Anaerolineae bacterium]|nr:hypothetical protein [Anaerolineae bacterium]